MPVLDWIGKDAVSEHVADVPFRLLEEQPDRSIGDPEAGNMLIQGDNLLGLKALLPHYAGRVNCVYIDPPYNTGNEGWVYNDNVNSPEIREWLGETVGKEAEDLSRHDKWLCMMYPRIVLLRKLLAEDGAIFVTIDDEELPHLRLLMDHIFGRRNFVANFVWQSKDTPGNNSGGVAEMHNYVVAYQKSDKFDLNLRKRTDDQISNYSNPDDDPRGVWLGSPLTRAEHRDRDYYQIENKAGRKVWPPEGSSWRRPPETMERLAEEDRIWWGKDGDSDFPMEKKFLSEAKEGVVNRTWWPYEFAGSTRNASAELKQIFDGVKKFDTPKPSQLVHRIIEMATGPQDVILDSFAGSGTTGHAVMQQNHLDGGQRQFILVEIEEEVAVDVTAERLSRIINGYEYTGTEKTELLREKLTVTAFKNSAKIVEKMNALKEEHKDEYDGFRTKIEGDFIAYYGKKKIEDRMEGLGGGFRYFTVGPTLTTEDGCIREDIPYRELARYVYFKETGRPLPPDGLLAPPLVGTPNGQAVYLLYNGALQDTDPENGNVLTRSLANQLTQGLEGAPPCDGPKVVYGTACMISPEQRQSMGITFRQIPYDLQVA